ncbi:hypothetical protein niasHT_031307 [Heterodera trifolii]|uniref:DNA-directed DNA polymerase n=1 Tax=Heterodera trifolii TaxID=157864 RepID=A0ABD2ISX7_9BILA
MPSDSDRKRRTTAENSSKQSQTQPKQPRWDFRSMAYFEKYPTEPQMEEEMRQLRLAAANDQTGTGDANTSKNSEQQPLYKEITNHVHKIERFSVQRHITEFLLNAQHDQPDEALRQAFDELIARAVQNAENKSGRTVSKLGIMVSGKVLNDPVVLPMRPPIQNNVDVVMAELDKLGQSEGNEGGADKKTLLLSEPVEIIVTCLTPPVGSAPRLHPYQNWGYDEAQRIRIRNNDSYCLFHALVAGRAYHDRDIFCLTRNPRDEQPQFIANIMNRQDFCKDYEAFNRLLSNIGRMQTAVEELMNSSGIQNDKTYYGIEHIQHVQQYWSDLNIHARNKTESKFYAQGATVIFFHDYVTMGIGGQHVDSINDVLYAIEFIDRIPARSTNATQAIANDARFIMRKRGAVLSKKSKYQRKNNAIVSSSGILKHDLNNLRTKASVYIGRQLRDERMKAFFDDISNERGPLDPRLAYCGGRTGPLRLFAEPAEDEKISVFDIVSLYPWVNYDTDYPIGIPTIIHPNADEMNVNWTKPEHLQYRGLYRVRVIPPRGLRVPVLPMKIDERLLFSCCHRCAALFRKCVTRCSHKCTHSDQQRAFTGNFTHIELEKALNWAMLSIDFGGPGITQNGVIRFSKDMFVNS